MKIWHISGVRGDVGALRILREQAGKEKDLSLIVCAGDLIGPCFLVSNPGASFFSPYMPEDRPVVESMWNAFRYLQRTVELKGEATFSQALDVLEANPQVPAVASLAAKAYRGAEKLFDQRAMEQYRAVAAEVNSFPVPFGVIAGKFDSFAHFPEAFKGRDLYGVAVKLEDVKFAGIGGARHVPSLVPPTRLIPHDENLFTNWLGSEKVDPDVALIHEIPFGILDTNRSGQHLGSEKAREYIEVARPRLVLCGDARDEYGAVAYGPEECETVVVTPGRISQHRRLRHCGSFAEIEIEDGAISVRPMYLDGDRIYRAAEREFLERIENSVAAEL